MILSELYKVFIKQRLILFLIVLLMISCVYHIFIGYDTTNTISNCETYYNSFFEKYQGKITDNKTEKIKVCDVSKSIAGIVFIDDNSVRSKYYKSLYSAYIYLNPNYKNKTPLSIRSIEKFFRNKYEVQIKDFDDFKWDNY